MDNPIEVLADDLVLTTEKSLALQSKIMEATAQLQEQLQSVQAREQEVRDAIKKAMEANNVKKFENDRLSITYIAESERVGIDMDRLRTEKPNVVKEYQKITKVKPSIRIKVKG